MKIHLPIDTPEDVTPEQIKKYNDIMQILIDKGALDGVRGGSAIIHFDQFGIFQGIELHYWPWRRRK